jgi:uncharacterized protein YciI
MYYVTFYEVVPAQAHLLPEVYPRHRAFLDEFAQDGQLAMIGIFGNPLEEGSMAVFRSREAAESFVTQDPFVVEGLARLLPIREWNPIEFPAT